MHRTLLHTLAISAIFMVLVHSIPPPSASFSSGLASISEDTLASISNGTLANISNDALGSTTELSIPLHPSQSVRRWRFIALPGRSVFPLLHINSMLITWVSAIWVQPMGWLPPTQNLRRCESDTRVCIDLSTYVDFRKAETAWLAVAVWAKESLRMGADAEMAVWSIAPYNITFQQTGGSPTLGQLRFMDQSQSTAASEDVTEVRKRDDVDKVGNELSIPLWTDRLWVWLNKSQQAPPLGMNVFLLGQIFIHSLIALCWSQHSDDKVHDTLLTGPIIRGGQMTIRMLDHSTSNADVTYEMLAEGLRRLHKKIGFSFVGDLTGTIGLQTRAKQVQLFAEVVVKRMEDGNVVHEEVGTTLHEVT